MIRFLETKWQQAMLMRCTDPKAQQRTQFESASELALSRLQRAVLAGVSGASEIFSRLGGAGICRCSGA